MQFLTRDELRRLFTVAHKHDKRIHLLLVVTFWSGLRISETLAIRGRDVRNGELHVKRLKRSNPTIHKLHVDADPVFDSSPLIEFAKANPDSPLFDFTPQWINRLLKRCCSGWNSSGKVPQSRTEVQYLYGAVGLLERLVRDPRLGWPQVCRQHIDLHEA